MTEEERDIAAFVRLVEALRSYLDTFVFVGGWAHRLFRLHPLAQRLEYPPLMTHDADIALPSRFQAVDDQIRERLLEAGFREEFSGEYRPPLTRYRLGEGYGGLYAEFLTPLTGSGYKRDKSPDVTASIAGVSAQKLRHLDLLLIAPWSLTLGSSNGFPFSRPAAVRIPNAASYLTQKILTHSKRKPSERSKDVLYIYDTIETFGRSLTEVRQDWSNRVKPRIRPKDRGRVQGAADTMFGEITDDVRAAAREALGSGRAVSSQNLVEVCRAGLKAIFD